MILYFIFGSFYENYSKLMNLCAKKVKYSFGKIKLQFVKDELQMGLASS